MQSLTQPPNHALGYALYANNAQQPISYW